MSKNAREAILAEAKVAAQLHGYSGINFRTIAESIGIKNASIYYYFSSKAELGAEVAKRYWKDTEALLERLQVQFPDPYQRLNQYPTIFRSSLEDGNRLCLSSFMSAEYEDLPEEVKNEVRTFADINIAWLTKALIETGLDSLASERRGRGIFTAIAGAQLISRTRSDLHLFDELIQSYREAGMIPAINLNCE
ncbi:TetR/AcrR family transcriptional regulator [Pseudomonas sp. BN411]|uniref:TetR/AcrR family transcriptional regulator n=1 Tax=Pseudomonas sp. BN411 TaxID=2567887 RepID=UPI0024543D50|nr:TetR/AcrR family transcriptional regulator [Pseudomonas sp. BN411]MDH4564245.1 TetR/AcrR family transcriptional regulator [Pseudomonas sp. BN411]